MPLSPLVFNTILAFTYKYSSNLAFWSDIIARPEMEQIPNAASQSRGPEAGTQVIRFYLGDR